MIRKKELIENKGSISLLLEDYTYALIEFVYPATSELQINFRYTGYNVNIGFYDEDDYILLPAGASTYYYKFINPTNVYSQLAITSITPESDDKYIYTF